MFASFNIQTLKILGLIIINPNEKSIINQVGFEVRKYMQLNLLD